MYHIFKGGVLFYHPCDMVCVRYFNPFGAPEIAPSGTGYIVSCLHSCRAVRLALLHCMSSKSDTIIYHTPQSRSGGGCCIRQLLSSILPSEVPRGLYTYWRQACSGGGGKGEGGVLGIMHGRSRVTIDPRIPTMPGRSTSGFAPTRQTLLAPQARSET